MTEIRLGQLPTRLRDSVFLRAIRVSLITIHALLLREATTRYGQRSAGYVWALVQPLLQLGALMAIFSYVNRLPPVGDSMVVFFMTGIMPLFLFRGAIVQGAKAIVSNQALMTYPQVRGFEVVTARVVLEILTSAVVVFVVVLFMRAFYGLPITSWISEPLELCGAIGTLFFMSYAVGFLSGQIGRMLAQWADLMSALSRVLFFTSGVWYTIDTLPAGLREIVAYNPLAQVIEWIRDASIRGFDSLHFDPTYPLTFSVVCLFIGLAIEWLFRISGFDLDKVSR